MVNKRAQELLDMGNKLFTEKIPYDGLCQELAFQFVPDLADFTHKLILGEEFCDHIMDSYPWQCSRDLTNSLSAMLRPSDRPWFKSTTQDDEIDADEANARYMQRKIDAVMRRKIYDPRAKFVRATKETDRHYVNFGQGVLSVESIYPRQEMARRRVAPFQQNNSPHLFFRSFHTRDTAWMDDRFGEVNHLHRKDTFIARALVEEFDAYTLHPSIRKAAENEPGKEFPIRVIVLPAREYDYVEGGVRGARKRPLPYVAIYIDESNQEIIKEAGRPIFPYIVPRWLRFANYQYAFSPATMPGLVDGRMAQMLGQILLEAGEKAVNPPLVGGEHAVRESNLQAGAISWVDMDYDKKVSDLLAPIKMTGDVKVGFEMMQQVHQILNKAFFLDKLTLPEAGDKMTATEVQRRLEEHVRNLLPLFEPMQIEYNTRLLDKVFTVCAHMNLFDRNEMPDALSGADITWSFESPLQQAQMRILAEQAKATWEMEALGKQIGASASATKPDIVLRDGVRGIGGPASWRKTDAEQAEESQQRQQAARIQQGTAAVHGAAQVAGAVGDAAKKLREGGMGKVLQMPQPGQGGMAGGMRPPQIGPVSTQPISPAADIGAAA